MKFKLIAIWYFKLDENSNSYTVEKKPKEKNGTTFV